MGTTNRGLALIARLERPGRSREQPAKRIKRVAFGIMNSTHWRVRILLYAGRPDWTKFATITPTAP